MSSMIQEREAQRAASAKSIRPGWAPQALSGWKPKCYKPELKHLIFEATARNKAVPNLRGKQEYVTWLSLNGPDEGDEEGAGTAEGSVHSTSFDENKGSIPRPK